MGFLVKRVGLVPASFIVSFVIVTYGSTCDQPTSPHGSVIIHPTQREKYQNGQVILFGCKQGFYLDGMPIITCNGNKWTQTQFRCLGFCPELRNILNGKVSYVNPKVGEAAIEFRCANNSFRLIGNTKLECIDGRWNGKLPYCHKLPSCVRLQSPANGTLLGSDNSHSAEAKFTCFTGFDLFGAPTLTCNKGVWSSRVPTCKAYCTKIRDLPNGHVFGTRFSHGQVVSFKCKHGYELDGDRSLRCINGRWNSSVPQCKVMQCVKPSIPRNSRIIYPRTDQVRYTHGTTLYLACQQGHLLTGSPIMVCNYTTWLKREFRCIASCPILGPIKNGVITHITRKGGSEVEIKCHANYTLFGSSRLNCINGEWSSSIPSCKAPCNDPGFPENGNGQWRDLKHNSWVTFSCNEKYQLEGRKQIQCKDGVWNGNRPKCLVVQCGDPGTPTNGKQIVNKGFEYGGSVEFKCNKNYNLEGTRIIYCRADKLWSASVPHCRASCKDPGNPLNGRKDDHDFRHKKTVSFTFQKNYALEGARTVKCLNGQWSAKRPLCLALCPTLIALTNGRIQGTDFRHGRSIKFWCSRGYTRVGTFSVTCKKGKWGAPFPVCKASCARPRIPVNGKIVGNIFSHGKSVLFYCSSGYTKVGARSIMCDDGKWDKPFPVCKGICPTPSNPQNGKVSQMVSLDKRFLDGDEAAFSCNRGYDLIGKKKLRCVGKVWDFGEPECKAPCNPPGFPANGNGQWRDLKHNSWVTFSCNKKYQLEGRRQIQCKDGIWSGNRPKCVGVCAEPGKLINGKVVGSNYSHGAVIKFECSKGYELRGSANLMCKGGVWEGQFPECEECVRVGAVF